MIPPTQNASLLTPQSSTQTSKPPTQSLRCRCFTKASIHNTCNGVTYCWPIDLLRWYCSFNIAVKLCTQKYQEGWRCRLGEDISNPLVVSQYLQHVYHTVHPRNCHRHQVIFPYYWCRIEVLLPLKIQWTKLWCANGPILILMRGFSVVCRYLFWLTILRASRRKNRVVLAPVLDLDLPVNSNILRWANLKQFEYG